MNTKTKLYRAVSIDVDHSHCDAVTEKLNQRFLSQDAPLLPLQDCSQPQQCSCKYQHWDDRRQEDRRAVATGIASQYYDGDEKRASKGRRKSDNHY